MNKLRLKKVRTDRGLTQKDVAKMLYLSIDTYGRYERGDFQMPYPVLEQLSKFFNVPAGYLLGFDKASCKVGDPLYYIADEDDEGNEIPTVKEVDGGIRAVIITDTGIRVADYAELAQIVNYSSEVGTRYAYLSREDAMAALEGAKR